MTGMLASVNSLQEALLALDAKVDIIDLKQPALGALGALAIADVRHIVSAIAGRCPVSATIGDLPMQAESVFNAAAAMAETGIDYIKIGFFPGGDWQGTITKLALTRTLRPALIAVLFADTSPDMTTIELLKESGFAGVMLDTMDKSKGSLTQVMSAYEIGRFTALAKNRQLLCGLAGSLRVEDIAGLLHYEADYLGFRGALCLQHKRTAQLDKQLIAQIKQTIEQGL